MNAHDIAPIIIKAVVQFYTESGVDEQSEDCNDFPLESIIAANSIFETVDFYNPDLEWSELQALAYGLWLMAYGLWPIAYGLWLMAYDLRLIAYGLWLMAYGNQPQR